MPKAANKDNALSVAELKRLLSYNPETGEFIWLVNRNSYGGMVRPGTPAGSIDRYGYLMIIISGLTYPAHRLAWYMHYGVWPSNQIDHINMLSIDNRIANLREATMGQQRSNQHVRKDSRIGLKGVRAHKDRFGARITKDGVTYSLGRFDTAEEAHEAYATKAVELHGEFARSR